MEIGDPKLFAEANRVAREMDRTQMEELGPFLRALSAVTFNAELQKPNSDKIIPGYYLGGNDFNMAGSFPLWRGATMRYEWLKPYEAKIGQVIKLSQSFSCSLNPLEGLKFANRPDDDKLKVPTLFIISVQNFV